MPCNQTRRMNSSRWLEVELEVEGVRDTFFVEYDTDASDIWGGDVQADVFDGLAFPNGNPFADLISAEKKWTRPVTRTHPAWIENLPRIETWR